MTERTDRAGRRIVQPVEVDAVTVVAVVTAIWAVLLVVGLVMLSRLDSAGHAWWVSAALAGFLLGLVGVYCCVRRRARLRCQEPSE